MIYIAIVDNERCVRSALKDRLSRFKDFEILFTAENGRDFLEAMINARKTIEPDIVLMDIDMPIMNGIQAIEEAKLRYKKTKYIVLTIFDEDEKIFNAIKAGADGYLLKDEPVEKIKDAIFDLLKGEGAPMSPAIARKVLNLLSNAQPTSELKNKTEYSSEYNLTDREKEILTLLVDGLEYKEIASILGLSPNTVRNNITKIYSKLHVTSRMQAAKLVNKSSKQKN
ncbi:MAG: response regulator transcription factor [Crocinitomicaceae bacterium]|nr:response regulator transcription factor [Crocinitomicaceae bacterium]MBK8924920.1 response regulator transcription factor [Crocinitomicaceae bacterium]